MGAWDDHPDYQYTGVSNQKKAGIKDLTNSKPGVSVGWDISHARRFVHVFDGLYHNKTILSKTFPTRALMEKLSNQLLYGVFNKDFKRPLFTNFMGGKNGWFRVSYSERKGFGYEPWGMSRSVLTGGFGFWSAYNKNIELVFKSIIGMLKSNDPIVKRHVEEHYERNFWYEYKRIKSLNFEDKNDSNTQRVMLQLLPSMCFHSANPLQ